MFDSHSKDRHGNICQNGTAVLLKFASLNDLERYIKLIYYNEMQHETLYFQVQFISVNFLPEHLQIIKSRLKAQKRKYNENSELKRFKNKMSKHLSAGSSIFRIFQKDSSNKDTVSSLKFSLVRQNHSKGKYGMDRTTFAQYVIKLFIKDQLKIFYNKTIRTMK